jgi:hypothetical protein
VQTDAYTGNFQVDVGYSVGSGFAVHADLLGAYAFSYDVESTGETEATSDGAALSMNLIGAGATYHLMPIDLFLSAGAGASFAYAASFSTVEDTSTGETTTTSTNDNTDPGFGTWVSLGKLFPVGTRWALGGTVNYAFMTYGVRDDSRLSLEQSHSLWLAFSAAYSP